MRAPVSGSRTSREVNAAFPDPTSVVSKIVLNDLTSEDCRVTVGRASEVVLEATSEDVAEVVLMLEARELETALLGVTWSCDEL